MNVEVGMFSSLREREEKRKRERNGLIKNI